MAEVSGPRTFTSRVMSGNGATGQYKFVWAINNLDVGICATSGQTVYGILQNKPADDRHASVVVNGFSKITLGSSLGADATVMNGGAGFAVQAVSGSHPTGRLNTGGTSGAIAEMFITMTGTGN